jgi:hypothetical protein
MHKRDIFLGKVAPKVFDDIFGFPGFEKLEPGRNIDRSYAPRELNFPSLVMKCAFYRVIALLY